MKSKENKNTPQEWKRRDVLIRLSSGLGLGILGVPLWKFTGCQIATNNLQDGPQTGERGQRQEARPTSGRSSTEHGQGQDASETSSLPERAEFPTEPTPEMLSDHDEPVFESQACRATEDNIEGPFYRANAPWQTQLVGPKEPGTLLTISGVVYGPDCRTPLPNITVDVWHANHKGSYDNDGRDDPPNNAFHLRGRMRTNAQGQYEYKTIVPGRYLNGGTYRPSHIHYKVYGPGHKTLTTQLYFAGDPFIKGDSFVRPSLIIPLQGDDKKRQGVFPIVLQQT